VHAFGLAGFDSDASNPLDIATREWRRMLPSRRAQMKSSLP
jgi:hypothetical protein